MSVVARFNLTSGLHTGAGQAGQSHCADVVNFYSDQGRAKKRKGMVHVRGVTGPKTQTRAGFSVGTAEPATVTTGANTGTSLQTTWTVGCASAFNTLVLSSGSGEGTHDGETYPTYSLRDLTVEYWNGSAWTGLEVAWGWNPGYSSAVDSHSFAPLAPRTTTGALETGPTEPIRMSFIPPTDWATKTINTFLAYYIRVRGYTAGHLVDSVIQCNTNNGWAHAVTNRVLHINTWIDRAGSAHEFIVHRYGESAAEIRYVLDGVTLTPSEGLAPNSTATLFGDDTRVSSFYHQPTDRIIGYISGHTWFYAIPGNSEIYNLDADPVGSETPYASWPLGLRAGIPEAKAITLYDGRIFVAYGDTLYWSAPGVYADIWPAGNEIQINDGNGNISGLLVFGGALVMFKEGAVYNIQSDGTEEGYSAVPLNGGKGGIGGGANCGNFGVWMAKDGIYQYDGTDTVKLSSAIDEAFRVSLGADLSRAVAVFHEPLNQYRVFYPSQDPVTLDRALYLDLTGYKSGEDQQELAVWPQGKYASTDYWVFSCIHEDRTVTPPRTLAGDIYGNVWELDQGLYEANPVKAKAIQSIVNGGRSAGVTITNITGFIANTGNVDVTLKVTPDDREDLAASQTISPYRSTSSQLFTAAGLFDTTTVFPTTPTTVTAECPQDINLRQFAVSVTHAAAGEVEIIGFEVEANASGRRRGT